MDHELLKAITVAAFLHDTGKFAERAGQVTPPANTVNIKAEYGYEHAYYTEQALEKLFSGSTLRREFGGSDVEQDERVTMQKLAARHHNPLKNRKWKQGTVLEMIIQEADKLAAGHEREAADEESSYPHQSNPRKDKVPLLSILGRVELEETKARPDVRKEKGEGDRRYRIARPPLLEQEKSETCFPVTKDNYQPHQVQADYAEHWQNFADDILTWNSDAQQLDLLDHFETIFNICQVYQWCLPESTRAGDLQDTSLFDHQKATAALAACIYYYHFSDPEQPRLTQAAVDHKSRGVKKYLLFHGDIGGIQNFIYQISSKGAYKMLKGRSFYIQLLAEILARLFMEEFKLTPANIIYSGGGKFFLLLPNLPRIKDRLRAMDAEINHDLFRKHHGDLYIRTGWEELSGHDLLYDQAKGGRSLSAIWDELARGLVLKDRKRYAQLAGENYDLLFGVRTNATNRSCNVCHAVMPPAAEDEHCPTCAQLKKIGEKLRDAEYLVLADSSATLTEGPSPTLKLFGKNVWILEREPAKPPAGSLVWALNNVRFGNIAKKHKGTVNAAPFMVGGNHRFDKNFSEIAEMAQGVPRLGILRMDVDNLGRLFADGLKRYKHRKDIPPGRCHSLGRISTMSWQLGMFFTALIPKLIREKDASANRVTVVYSGGDDLFVLGCWDALPEFALHLHERFSTFCCDNPAFTISGGMVLTGGKFPIYKSAEMAGRAESQAKHRKTRFTGGNDPRVETKNSFTFLDTPMHWREFGEVHNQFAWLRDFCADRRKRPLIRKLSDLAVGRAMTETLLTGQKKQQDVEDISQLVNAERWRWRMHYSLARFGEIAGVNDRDLENLKNFILSPVAGTERQGIDLLGLLSRWSELYLRETKKVTRGDGHERK